MKINSINVTPFILCGDETKDIDHEIYRNGKFIGVLTLNKNVRYTEEEYNDLINRTFFNKYE